jgi:hypothetical protein
VLSIIADFFAAIPTVKKSISTEPKVATHSCWEPLPQFTFAGYQCVDGIKFSLRNLRALMDSLIAALVLSPNLGPGRPAGNWPTTQSNEHHIARPAEIGRAPAFRYFRLRGRRLLTPGCQRTWWMSRQDPRGGRRVGVHATQPSVMVPSDSVLLPHISVSMAFARALPQVRFRGSAGAVVGGAEAGEQPSRRVAPLDAAAPGQLRRSDTGQVIH